MRDNEKMIGPEEIYLAALDLGIDRVNVERDYLFGWLIAGVFGESTFSDQLILKGGNALRKGYLPATRFSHDLDFTTTMALDANRLLELNSISAD